MATKNFQVTIGYKSVITIDLKAETEDEAKKKAVAIMQKERDKMFVKSNVCHAFVFALLAVLPLSNEINLKI